MAAIVRKARVLRVRGYNFPVVFVIKCVPPGTYPRSSRPPPRRMPFSNTATNYTLEKTRDGSNHTLAKMLTVEKQHGNATLNVRVSTLSAFQFRRAVTSSRTCTDVHLLLYASSFTRFVSSLRSSPLPGEFSLPSLTPLRYERVCFFPSFFSLVPRSSCYSVL